jgi:hypothetical protein
MCSLISCQWFEACSSEFHPCREGDIPSAGFDFLEKSRHPRSLEQVRIKLSSGLKAIRVMDNECPASGSPTASHVSVDWILTTAWSALLARQAVAMSLPS